MNKQYANRCGYSDVHPYEVVEVRTASKMLVREMDATRDPSWKMEFHPGGFFGHVANDRDQKWFYQSNEAYPVVAVRKRKDGRWYDKHGNRYSLSDKPHKFHDHNF